MKIITVETLKRERRKQEIIDKLQYRIGNKVGYVEKKLIHGEMELINIDKPLGEMFTTPEGIENLLKKVTLDVDFGREQVPLLYTNIYQTITNPNFPRLVPISEFAQAQVVFLEHLEGEEVRFGARTIYKGDGVPIVTYTAGFDGWTLEVEKFDETWRITELNRALGEAYNALLNHIHLYPTIISHNYPAKNKTAASTEGDNYLEKVRNTIRNAIKHAQQDLNKITNARRNPSVLLCSTANLIDIQEALGRLTIKGTEYQPLSQIQTIIAYDGWSVTVGEKTYTYPGVPAGKCYLIDPKRYFRELVKQDLTIESGEPDTTRLVRAPIIAYAMRGVWASPENAVEEVTLP